MTMMTTMMAMMSDDNDDKDVGSQWCYELRGRVVYDDENDNNNVPRSVAHHPMSKRPYSFY